MYVIKGLLFILLNILFKPEQILWNICMIYLVCIVNDFIAVQNFEVRHESKYWLQKPWSDCPDLQAEIWTFTVWIFFTICLIRAAMWGNVPSDMCSQLDSDQPAHPLSLIRVFAVCLKKLCILSYPKSDQWRFRSACAFAQADLNLHWAHMS